MKCKTGMLSSSVGKVLGQMAEGLEITKLVTEKKTAQCLIKTDILQSWSKTVKRKTALRGGVSVKTPT